RVCTLALGVSSVQEQSPNTQRPVDSVRPDDDSDGADPCRTGSWNLAAFCTDSLCNVDRCGCQDSTHRNDHCDRLGDGPSLLPTSAAAPERSNSGDGSPDNR